MFDMNVFKRKDRTTVQLKLPNGEVALNDNKEPLEITIMGAKTPEAQAFGLDEYRKNKDKKQEGTLEQVNATIESTACMMATLTVDVKNINDENGKVIKVKDKEKLRSMYLVFPSIREQVVKAHQDDANFTYA